LGFRRHLAQDRAGAVEVPEVQINFGRKNAAGVSGQPAAGLQRNFHDHGERHRKRAVLLEIPGARWYVVIGGHRAADLHAAHRSVSSHDPGHEMVRRTWQMRDMTVTVESRITGAERLGWPPPRAREKCGVVLAHAVNLRWLDSRWFQRTVGRCALDAAASADASQAAQGWQGDEIPGPLDGGRAKLAPVIERPVRHQPQCCPPRVEGLHAVYGAEYVRVDRGAGSR